MHEFKVMITKNDESKQWLKDFHRPKIDPRQLPWEPNPRYLELLRRQDRISE